MISLIGKLLAMAIALVLLALAISLAVSNPVPVAVALWPFDDAIRLPLWLFGLGSFALGLVLGGLAMVIPLIRSRWQTRQLNSAIRKLEQANHQAGPDQGKPAATPSVLPKP